MNQVFEYIVPVIEFLALLFVLCAGLFFVAIAIIYVIDKTQTDSSIRYNYPVIGRMRYVLEHLGTFFRQYFFAMDREELPFNRAERSWVYRAAKNIDNTVAFGSTRDLTKPGTICFNHSMFPITEEDATKLTPITIGPDTQHPYTPEHFFNISGMSYGALSAPAVKALSLGAKKANIWLNTGEGGFSPYHKEGGCDIVFQIGTAKFGVCNDHGSLDEYALKDIAANENVKMFELKLSQGAKPGKGGMLPAAKITEEIAHIRGIAMGKDAISPNRHPEITSSDDLLDMIDRIRKITQKPVGIKCCIGKIEDIEHLCQTINTRGIDSAPDFITIDGSHGGTGAAPMSLMDNVGMPLFESLPKVVNSLKEYKLKERICVIASGKLITPSQVAWALCMGADFVTSARGFLFSLGCIQALQCNKNTCPTGVTTHNKRLQKGLNPHSKSSRVAHYALNMEKEVAMIAHSCGVDNARKLDQQHVHIFTES